MQSQSTLSRPTVLMLTCLLLLPLGCQRSPAPARAESPNLATQAAAPNHQVSAPERGKAFEEALVVAIHHFAEEGEIDHLRALLEQYPRLVDRNITIRNEKPGAHFYMTPLDRAVLKERREVVQYLIGKGADVNYQLQGGWTILHTAAKRGDLEIVKLLVNAGAKVDARTEATPETFSVWPGSSDGKPQRLPAVPSRTPLDVAQEDDHPNVVAYLRSVKR
jgi:ankyrin repeat protein